jgi:GDP-mannose pyrophosphatase NudK
MKTCIILSERILGSGWGRLVEYEIELRHHDETSRIDRECYHRRNAASVLLHDPYVDTVVLVRQFRLGPLLNGDAADLLETAAGTLDGTTPEDCAEREAFEETGCQVTGLRKIGDVYSMPAAVTEKVSLFIGNYVHGSASARGGLAEEGEHIEVVEMPFREALAMVDNGQIVDMKTIISLQALALGK